MSSPLITIDSKSFPSLAADRMFQNNVRHLLVVDDKYDVKQPISIVTSLDFTKCEELVIMRMIKTLLKRY
jgi:hypothetical protein